MRATTIHRKPDVIRDEMQRHRTIIDAYERQAAGLEENLQRTHQRSLDLIFGIGIGMVLSTVVWLLGLFLIRWGQS